MAYRSRAVDSLGSRVTKPMHWPWVPVAVREALPALLELLQTVRADFPGGECCTAFDRRGRV